MGARFHEDAGFLMSWLCPKTTRIEGVVICVFAGEFERPGHQLGPRLLVVLGNKLTREGLDDAASVLLTDPPKVIGELPRKVKKQVVEFVNKSRDAVLGYWNCELDSKEMCDLIERIEGDGMSRNDKTRKKSRKARVRAEREAELRAEEERRLNPPAPTPINYSRLRQIFANMSFRSHEKGGTKPFKDFVLGPNVTASTPEELEARTDDAFVEMAKGQKPS